jgi:hypothetical protein
MAEYEIRLLTAAMKPVRTVSGTYSSDDAAVRAAKECAAGLAVEVWRESICIFRAPADAAHNA